MCCCCCATSAFSLFSTFFLWCIVHWTLAVHFWHLLSFLTVYSTNPLRFARYWGSLKHMHFLMILCVFWLAHLAVWAPVSGLVCLQFIFSFLTVLFCGCWIEEVGVVMFVIFLDFVLGEWTAFFHVLSCSSGCGPSQMSRLWKAQPDQHKFSNSDFPLLCILFVNVGSEGFQFVCWHFSQYTRLKSNEGSSCRIYCRVRGIRLLMFGDAQLFACLWARVRARNMIWQFTIKFHCVAVKTTQCRCLDLSVAKFDRIWIVSVMTTL